MPTPYDPTPPKPLVWAHQQPQPEREQVSPEMVDKIFGMCQASCPHRRATPCIGTALLCAAIFAMSFGTVLTVVAILRLSGVPLP